MKRMFIPRTISQHKINNVDKTKRTWQQQQQLANTKQKKLLQASNREEISKTDMRKQKQIQSKHTLTCINLHFTMLDIKNELEKSKLNTLLKQINSQIIIVASFGP